MMVSISNETPKRLKPTPEVLRKLFLLSGNECAMPDCSTVLIDGNGTMVGDIAHIAAAKSDGSRFDSKMTNEERRGFENLVLLCATHHRQVDGPSSEVTREEMEQINATHEARFSAVEETIRKRFEPQFPDATDGLVATKPTTLNGLRQVFGEDAFSDDDVATETPKLAAYADKLANVPEVYRDFVCQVIARCVKIDSWRFDRPSVPCHDLIAAFNIGDRELIKAVGLLDSYGFASFDEDFDNRPLVTIYDPGDLVRWCDITQFCDARGVPLERVVVDVSFGLLDT